jgi:hypothetical protein
MPKQSLLKLNFPCDDGGPYREWYIGFTANTNNLPWLHNWAMRKDPVNCRHVYAFTQIGDFVLYVEPELSKINFTIKYPNEETPQVLASNHAVELTNHGHTILRTVHIPSIRGKKSVFNFVPSCVTVVKCSVGYSSLALTPFQLFKSLLHNGAELIRGT